MKKIGYLLLVPLLSSCSMTINPQQSESKLDDSTSIFEQSNQESTSQECSKEDTRIPAPSYVYDDFNNGVDSSKWYICKRNWSSAVSNGQKVENVNYTEDGLLVLSSNGKYALENPSTGGVILSKDTFGPGKFEVAMKLLPRLGVCNAFWTYNYVNDDTNHEIDIELPGNKSYSKVLNTNWTGVNANQYTSNAVKAMTPLNDNKFHKYTFEWSIEQQYVKYYIDDVLTSTITKNIPSNNGNLWLGVWQPVSWCGEANFESDYMLVDWVAYQKSQNETGTIKYNAISQVAGINEYPKSPILLPTRNYISNGKFDNHVVAYDGEMSLYTANGENYGKVSGKASQLIEEVYEGYTFDYSLKACSTDVNAKTSIEFYDETNQRIGTQEFSLYSEEFKEFKMSILAVKNTSYMKVCFESSNLILDDIAITNK